MNILYCGDEKICDGLLMSVVSLLRVVPEEIHIYVLTQSPTKCFEKFADYLDSYVKGVNDSNSLCLIDITLQFQSCLPEANMDTRFTPACMFRLYADLVPELPDRLLYLDYDVICLKDPTVFYNQSIDGIEYVGCLDYYGKWYYTPLRHNYCNSGVLLMNLAEMKRTGLLRKCREECRDKKMFLPDQHALNHNVTARRIETNRFNDQRRTHPDTVFRHFSTTWRVFPYPHTVSIKPWNEQGMRDTLKETRFASIIEEYKRIKNKILKTMNHIKEEIPVFFTIDDNYTPLARCRHQLTHH